MSYQIKTYQPEYLSDQVRVTFEVTDKWKYQPQISIDGLKQSYSEEKFNPNTRLYAFLNRKMVGCISSAKTQNIDGIQFGSTRTPFVIEGHDKAKQLLFDESLKALKIEGVDVLRASSSDNLGYSQSFLEKNGFVKKDESFILAKEKLEDLKLADDHSELTEYTEDDEELLKSILPVWIPGNPEPLFNFYNDSRRRKGNDKVSWQLLKRDGKIEAFSILMRSDRESHQYRGPFSYLSDKLENKELILKKLYSAHKVKLDIHNSDLIQVFLSVNNKIHNNLYETIGFNLDMFYLYEKDLRS